MAEEEKYKKQGIQESETLIRILGQDIPGSRMVYPGLTRIKGVSWIISNIVCKKLEIDKRTRIDSLSKEDLGRIEDFLKNLDAPDFIKNHRSDLETGETKHLLSIDLDMKKEFDIKRMKQIKSYKGVRHTFKLPVRGQRTRSNFRKSGIAVGVKRPKQGKKS
jgi:small subunit ribosomal protein S13